MKLANMIRERISNLQGEIGVYFYDIKQDNSFFVGNCDVFPSLGIAKLVLLIEVFRQVEEKVIRLDDTYLRLTRAHTPGRIEISTHAAFSSLTYVQ